MSVIIFITLLCGIGAGVFVGSGIDAGIMEKMSSLLLLLLLFSVGIDMGLNKQVFSQIKKQGFKILLIPIGVAIGSLLGGSVVSLFFPQTLRECLAISSGMGWYSLSGILLTKAGNILSIIVPLHQEEHRQWIPHLLLYQGIQMLLLQ